MNTTMKRMFALMGCMVMGSVMLVGCNKGEEAPDSTTTSSPKKAKSADGEGKMGGDSKMGGDAKTDGKMGGDAK